MGYSEEDPVGNLRALEVLWPPWGPFQLLPRTDIKAVFSDRDCLMTSRNRVVIIQRQLFDVADE